MFTAFVLCLSIPSLVQLSPHTPNPKHDEWATGRGHDVLFAAMQSEMLWSSSGHLPADVLPPFLPTSPHGINLDVFWSIYLNPFSSWVSMDFAHPISLKYFHLTRVSNGTGALFPPEHTVDEDSMCLQRRKKKKKKRIIWASFPKWWQVLLACSNVARFVIWYIVRESTVGRLCFWSFSLLIRLSVWLGELARDPGRDEPNNPSGADSWNLSSNRISPDLTQPTPATKSLCNLLSKMTWG